MEGAVVGVTIGRDRITRLDPSGYLSLRSGRFAQVDPAGGGAGRREEGATS